MSDMIYTDHAVEIGKGSSHTHTGMTGTMITGTDVDHSPRLPADKYLWHKHEVNGARVYLPTYIGNWEDHSASDHYLNSAYGMEYFHPSVTLKGYNGAYSYYWAQTFTPKLSHSIAKVRIGLLARWFDWDEVPGDLVIRITTVVDGEPTFNALTTGSIPIVSIISEPGTPTRWYDVGVAQVELDADTEYAIIVNSTWDGVPYGNEYADCLSWYGNYYTYDSYSRGKGWRYTVATGVWALANCGQAPYLPFDFAFEEWASEE